MPYEGSTSQEQNGGISTSWFFAFCLIESSAISKDCEDINITTGASAYIEIHITHA